MATNEQKLAAAVLAARAGGGGRSIGLAYDLAAKRTGDTHRNVVIAYLRLIHSVRFKRFLQELGLNPSIIYNHS